MTDEEFIKLYKEVLAKMKPTYDNTYDELLEKLNHIYLYVSENPNNIYVKKFIKEVLNMYEAIFFNRNLLEFLYLNNEKYYHNQIEIYKNLPYTTHPLYATYLSKMIPIPSDINDSYLSFKYLLEKYCEFNFNRGYLQLILDFVENNQLIMNGIKENYYSLEKEKRAYLKCKDKIYFRGLKEFAKSENLTNPYEAQNLFLSRTIDHIGKLYFFSLVKYKYYCYFLSRDINDGFGYDIYCYDRDYIENLINVKTTINAPLNDFFTITENEYKTMIESFSKPNARYIICRVFLDGNLEPTYKYLVAKDKNLVVEIDNEDLQYKLSYAYDNTLCFKKVIEKNKKKIL